MLHLIKLSVGSESPETLEEFQAERLAQHGFLFHKTRMFPKRRDEILDSGGSIYWVIKGQIRCRQKLLDIERVEADDGTPMTLFRLEQELVRTRPLPFRPFQGWRYFKPENAPEDMGSYKGEEASMPDAMKAELEKLGLL
ncbi:DUF1489 family protein [Kiloniella sp. b19]|uniref:DUF1489 family protein n=1 Tax=Kiloniella sp. GXU_MW_B19 TaxID=3141326 RepID=UPI0031D6CEC3